MIPKALGNPHLLSAILCLAAIHRQAIGLLQSKVQLAHLKWQTIVLFKSALNARSSESDTATTATSLLLCLCELFEGTTTSKSYKTHLQGGGLLLTEKSLALTQGFAGPSAPTRDGNDTRLVEFLRHMYVAIGITAMLSGPVDEAEMARIELFSGIPNSSYLDVFTGCSSDLIPIFSEIRLLIDNYETLRLSAHKSEYLRVALDLLMGRGRKLVQHVLLMLTRIGSYDVRFHRDFQETMDHSIAWQYLLLNQCYHYVALIMLHCKILGSAPNSPVVQQAVHSIVSLGSTIQFWKTKTSPAIALTQPLFVAGSAAIEKVDRDDILHLLKELYRCFGCGSVKSIREKFARKWEEEAKAAGASH